jgi:uncharacterized repeat protein (TIGR03806 family)
MSSVYKPYFQTLVLAFLMLSIAACSSSSSSSSTEDADNLPSSSILNAGASAPSGEDGDCNAAVSGVNWDALMDSNCSKLSDYNLFQDQTDPTAGPNAGGVPYDLSVALFTDYASKYRYVFIPEGSAASYSEAEVMDFPVGSVLVKTFAMPENTAFRDGAELLIETRLLIHRQNGWVALPYYWDPEDNGDDASLAPLGEDIANMTTSHNGVDLDFTYSVPDWTACTSCHTRLSEGESTFMPIGPKARFLNKDFTYDDSQVANQLTYWAEGGILTGLPDDMSSIMKATSFDDSIVASNLSDEALNDTAKAYLDINCAHCHRNELTLGEGFSGPAGSSGLQVEYNRPYADDPTKFGTCKVAVAGGDDDYPFDVIPQDSGNSYLLFRMNTNDSRHRMPELGRATIHDEGVALIRAWIDSLPAASCTP